MKLQLVVLSSFLISLLSIALILRVTSRSGIGLDLPGRRKVHKVPTPRVGGFGICLGLLPALFFAGVDRVMMSYLTGAAVIICICAVDDIKGLGWKVKMSGILLSSTAVIFYGGVKVANIGNLFGGGTVELGVLAVPFTYVCVLGVVSAINLIDGLNGLASGVSLIILLALSYFSYLAGDARFMLINMALFGATAGFFLFNYPNGRIFLGDTGSGILGFTMAFTSIMVFQGEIQRNSGYEPIIPVIVLAVPIYDTVRVMAWRIIKGKNPFMGDKTHLHHIIMRLGLSQRKTSGVIWALTLAFALAAVAMRQQKGWVLFLALICGYGVMSAVIAVLLDARKVVARREYAAGEQHE